MDDIISQGAEGGPGHDSGRRRLILAAALVVLAALVIVEHLPHGRPGHARRPAAAITAGKPPQLGSGPPASVVPDGLAGPGPGFAASIRLPRAGVRPSWLWPATGRTEFIGGLPPDEHGYVFARMNGGWAVRPALVAPAGCGGCGGLPVPVYYLSQNARSATLAGIANEVAPAATAGDLWLTSYAPNAGLRTAVGTAREVTGTGAAVGPVRLLPPGYEIDQATSAGLLLAPLAGASEQAQYLLWSPAGVRRVFSDVIAATASAIAWVPACVATCVVHVLSLATGNVVTVTPSASVTSAEFSPDGRYLALGVSDGSAANSGELTVKLEVVLVRSGGVEAVPQTWVSSSALIGFGWPAGADDLIALLSVAARAQVVSWYPGAASLTVFAVAAAQDPASLIIG